MKKISLIGLTLSVLIILCAAFQYSKSLTPESVMQQLFNMNVPARYAFVSDPNVPKLAVLDISLKRQTGLITLQMPARIMSINKAQGLLAYSNGSRALVLRRLNDHHEQILNLSHPIHYLHFTTDNLRLIASGKKDITLLNVNNKEKQLLTGYQDIQAVVYTALADQLWILDNTSVLYRYDLTKNKQTRYELPAKWHHFSAAAVSPDNGFLAFGVQENDQYYAVIWNNENGQIQQKMPLTAPLVQPYIDNSGNVSVFIDQKGKGFILTGEDMSLITPLQSINPSGHYATGWLGSRLLVVGKALQLYEIPGLESIDKQSLGTDSRSLFITADSKYALISNADKLQIGFYDLQHGVLQFIPVTGISQPDTIIMGAGNTLCH